MTSTGTPTASDDAFQRKLRKAFLKIVEASKGKTCGKCRFASLSSVGIGHCTQHLNHEGGSLKIYRPGAYACESFEPEHSSD